MAQYFPTYRAPQLPPLARTITRTEYDAVVRLVSELGLENGWMQEMSAPAYYRPHFEREGHPFIPTPTNTLPKS